jgi:fructose 1,6-bisphosphatase
MFADPLNTPRLLDELSGGFRFVAGAVRFDLPADLHGMLATVAAGEPIRAVSSASSAEQAAAASAGDDPVLVVRCEGAFPSVADCLEPFAHAPLMPVSTNDDATTRPGIERVVGLGFQFSSGRLVGPRDLLGDRAYESARRRVLRGADDAPGPARLRPVPARPLV